MSTEIGTFEERLELLEAQCRQAREVAERAEQRCRHLGARLRVVCGLGVATLAVALFAAPASHAVAQSGYGATLQALINKTQFITVAGGQMYIDGTNLHVRNGLGATNTTNALGNVIIGYNALRGGGRDLRTGSHSLIAGDRNNYSSYGGIVVGLDNAILASYASVSGGRDNTASANLASVSGGFFNTASGFAASVSGGRANTASSDAASVSGGVSNTASGEDASVSGGGDNTASDPGASVSGGLSNTAGGFYTSVSGGFSHTRFESHVWQGGTLISGP